MSVSTFFFKIQKNAFFEANKFNNFNFTVTGNDKKINNVIKNQYANLSTKFHINKNTLYNSVTSNSLASFLFGCTRNQHFSTTQPNDTNEALMLVRFPNPILWMKMKWRFRKLNYFWDPEFDEGEFVRGARQALVTITHLIAENKFDELKGLLTKEALQKLRQEVTLTWPEILKQHIALRHHHIKAITPINIRMMENIKNEKRFCEVDILYIALKRIMYKERKNHRILVFNILSRFHRNYTDGAIPDWTVAIFTMDVVAHKPNW